MNERTDDRPNHLADGPPMPSEAALRAAMDRSDADVAAGRVVPLTAVLDDLRTAAARIRAKRNLVATTDRT